MVWVLMADFEGTMRPVGVASTEAKARAFYDADTTRDYMSFELDSIVGQDSQNPGEPAAPSELGSSIDALSGLNDSLSKMRESLRKQPRKKSYDSSLLNP